MGSRLAASLLLVAAGAGAVLAWQRGFWATLTGCALLIAGLLLAEAMRPSPRRASARPTTRDEADAAMIPLLLDQVPTPLVRLEGETATALNRAARQLFATDALILPPPAALASAGAARLSHEGRLWRIDRVQAPDSRFSIVALIDIEAESNAAEARAASEMIEILGHELLNGLAPIVSLAESADQVMAQPDKRERLLPEILGTLARRADGLMRFTASYRALARLPQPVPAPIPLDELAADLDRQFTLQWGERVRLTTEAAGDRAFADRDQLTQAIWALLTNGALAALDGAAPPALHLRLSATRIEVEDNGDGVPPDLRDRIFRPFFTTRDGGSGIGLSLARGIARAHGGELTLQPAMPTRFTLRLPAPLPPALPSGPDRPAAAAR